MRYMLIILLFFYSCGSKKEFIHSKTVEGSIASEQLHAELFRTTSLLELIDFKIRQVEVTDSAGNTRKETNIDVKKHSNRQELDTTKLELSKHEQKDILINNDSERERSGIIGSWVWIVGFIAVIMVTLVVAVYYLKK